MINEEDFKLLQEVNLELFEEENRLRFRRQLSIASRVIACFLILAISLYGYHFYSLNKTLDSKLVEYGDDAYCYMCGVKAYKSCGCVNFMPAYNDQKSFFQTIGEGNAVLNCVSELKEKKFLDKQIDSGNFVLSLNFTP